MRTLAVIAAAGVFGLAAVGTAYGQGSGSENWDGYSSGQAPYGDWVLYNGALMGLTGGQYKSPSQSYRVKAISQIGYALPLAPTSKAIVEGWFYDTNGGSSTKRSLLGLQSDAGGSLATDNSLVRIGCNNTTQYQIQYYSGVMQTVNTGLQNQTGWHYVRLELTNAGGGNWQCDWQINNVAGTPYEGTFTWAFAAATCNRLVLGHNLGCSTEVAWDNINWYVPEPCSLLALGAGLVGLAGALRRRA